MIILQFYGSSNPDGSQIGSYKLTFLIKDELGMQSLENGIAILKPQILDQIAVPTPQVLSCVHNTAKSQSFQ